MVITLKPFGKSSLEYLYGKILFWPDAVNGISNPKASKTAAKVFITEPLFY